MDGQIKKEQSGGNPKLGLYDTLLQITGRLQSDYS